MGNSVPKSYGQLNFNMNYKQPVSVKYNTKVAMWQLPYDARYKEYDEDGTKWFESDNKNGNDEIENAEQNLHMSFTNYKVRTKTVWYDDNSYDVESRYKNNTVTENHGENHVFVNIKDNSDRLVAEKIFGFDSTDGRKMIYKYDTNGNNVFTVVRIYSFDTTKNRATDVVNYGYTSDESALIKNCTFEKEYYMLNGKQVDAEKCDGGGYNVKDKDGKILTFQVE